ncbi:Small heat shock protein HSP16.5 [hydrothermal vent metagenome]|uniref:Small heat shock protein HSP16.5 n=1 Tax=hydrothermal vent metagenome TaxID=652676 RepID=A0A3B1CJY0_9ZZZZ
MAKKQESKELVRSESSKVLAPFEEVERWFEDVFRRPFSLLGPSWLPRMRFPELEEISPVVDIYEEGDDVVVKAEMPGIKKDDVDVSLTDNTITISGEKKKEEKVEKKNYYRLERSYGSFTRTFRLPAEVQSDKAKAKFKDGVLEIRVPKTEEAKKREKKVKVE